MFFYILIAFTTVLLFFILQAQFRKNRYFEEVLKLTVLPNCLPLIGHGYIFFGSTEKLMETLMKIVNTYETPVVGWIGPRLFAVINKPEDMDMVMNKCLQKSVLLNYLSDAIGYGLVSAPVEKWKVHRRLILPAFKQKILDSFVEIFSEKSEIMVDYLKANVNDRNVEMYRVINNAIIAMFLESAMGIDSGYTGKEGAGMGGEYGKCTEHVLKCVTERIFKVYYQLDAYFYRTKIGKQYAISKAKMRKFTSSVIEIKLLNLENEKNGKLTHNCDSTGAPFRKRKAFLDLLIELSEEGTKLTNSELREEVDVFMVAGSETSTTTLGFILLCLGVEQHVQDKLFEEIITVVGKDKHIEYLDLPRLQYLERCIKEAMRLFPAVPFILRETEQDFVLNSGATLPKGCSIILSLIGLHRDARYYPDPLRFNPDRFLPEEIEKRHPYAHVPFSGGIRNCIGWKFAIMSMKTILVNIIRNFKISTDYKGIEDIKIQMDSSAKPVGGYRIHYQIRQ